MYIEIRRRTSTFVIPAQLACAQLFNKTHKTADVSDQFIEKLITHLEKRKSFVRKLQLYRRLNTPKPSFKKRPQRPTTRDIAAILTSTISSNGPVAENTLVLQRQSGRRVLCRAFYARVKDTPPTHSLMGQMRMAPSYLFLVYLHTPIQLCIFLVKTCCWQNTLVDLKFQWQFVSIPSVEKLLQFTSKSMQNVSKLHET